MRRDAATGTMVVETSAPPASPAEAAGATSAVGGVADRGAAKGPGSKEAKR